MTEPPEMPPEEYEAATIEFALAGDADAGIEALRLCRAGLDGGVLSPRLAQYLADRLWLIDQAISEAEAVGKAKRSASSARSARDAAIASALCINRSSKRRDPIPEWHLPLAAVGVLLALSGTKPEKCKAAMAEARLILEGKDLGRSEAWSILKAHAPMRKLDPETLQHLAGPQLMEILRTYSQQTKQGQS
jgi:hypothetical protein